MPVPSASSLLSENGAYLNVLREDNALAAARPKQMEFATECENFFNASPDKLMIFEAGTGIGKSDAYMLVSALNAVRHEKRTIIATFTIELRDELQNIGKPACENGRINRMLSNLGLREVIVGSYVPLSSALDPTKFDKNNPDHCDILKYINDRYMDLTIPTFSDYLANGGDIDDIIPEDMDDLREQILREFTMSPSAIDDYINRPYDDMSATIGKALSIRKKENEHTAANADIVLTTHALVYRDCRRQHQTENTAEKRLLAPLYDNGCYVIIDEADIYPEQALNIFDTQLNVIKFCENMRKVYRDKRSALHKKINEFEQFHSSLVKKNIVDLEDHEEFAYRDYIQMFLGNTPVKGKMFSLEHDNYPILSYYKNILEYISNDIANVGAWRGNEHEEAGTKLEITESELKLTATKTGLMSNSIWTKNNIGKIMFVSGTILDITDQFSNSLSASTFTRYLGTGKENFVLRKISTLNDSAISSYELPNIITGKALNNKKLNPDYWDEVIKYLNSLHADGETHTLVLLTSYDSLNYIKQRFDNNISVFQDIRGARRIMEQYDDKKRFAFSLNWFGVNYVKQHDGKTITMFNRIIMPKFPWIPPRSVNDTNLRRHKMYWKVRQGIGRGLRNSDDQVELHLLEQTDRQKLVNYLKKCFTN